MAELFIRVLNMSITATWIALAVLVCRVFLQKAPKWTVCLLWAMVAVRLLIPGFWESDLSLVPSVQVIPEDIAVSEYPAIHMGISMINNAVNPVLRSQSQSQAAGESVLMSVMHWGAILWLMGMASMLTYSCVSYLRLRWQVRVSLMESKGVYLCDDIDTPFILGVLRPRIYIPSDMDKAHLTHVLAHEKAHLKRKDHWWKPLGFCLLCIHWFNPVLWVAYILLCRDIEQACDEKAIKAMDSQEKICYSQALIGCSSNRRRILACPLAFGEVSLRHRVKAVLSYKKPVVWALLASLVICGVTAVCFLTNPKPCIHAYQQETVTPTGCDHPGQDLYTCAYCWESYTQEVAQLSHRYSEGVVTQAATCAAEGVLTKTCEGCGAEQRESVPMHREHTFTSKVIRAATCTQEGEGLETCTCCGITRTIAYPKTAHHYVQTVIRPRGCYLDGVIAYACSCGDMYFETIPNTGHTFVMMGSYKICSGCGWRIPVNSSTFIHTVSTSVYITAKSLAP